MALVYIRKCPKCGRDVTLDLQICDCGTYVGEEPILKMEEEERNAKKQPEETGKKGNKKGRYVIRCTLCNHPHYFDSEEGRVEQCGNCGNKRIRRQEAKPVEEDPKPEQEKGELVLKSVEPYPGLQVSFRTEDAPVTLGRYASCAEFLQKDIRVSGEHCILYYENGQWYVKDNHSKNYTLADNEIVSAEQGIALKKGCRITLGNQMDSMELIVEEL